MKFANIIVLLFVSFSVLANTNIEATKESNNQLFKVSFISKADPIKINKIHTWIIHIEDINGNNIEDATITVDGGMPAHDHGLPTQPQITKHLGDGRYLLEGMKFHMLGYWTVTISISHGNLSDEVTFELNF